MHRLLRRGVDQLGRPGFLMAVVWCCMLFFAVQASMEGLNYIFGPLDQFDALFRNKYSAHIVLVRTHAVGSVLALCLGLFAFARQSHRLRIHRLVGRLYALGVIVGGATSLPMALMAEGGWTNRLAFTLQGLLWLQTLAFAIWAARSKNFKVHRRYMVRNYALTFSAVISRILLTALQESGLSFQEIYPLVAWTWVLGLAVGEWWLRYSVQIFPDLSKTSQRTGS